MRSLLVLLLAASAARASEFGHAGQVVPSGGFSFSSSSTGDSSRKEFLVAPELAWFVAEHFALGVSLRYEILDATIAGVDQAERTLAAVVPFAALDVPILHWVSLFPSAGLFFQSQSSDRKSWGVTAFVPVLFHPAPHFFLGFGPSF